MIFCRYNMIANANADADDADDCFANKKVQLIRKMFFGESENETIPGKHAVQVNLLLLKLIEVLSSSMIW